MECNVLIIEDHKEQAQALELLVKKVNAHATVYYAKDEKEAISTVFDSEWHKEVLDVRVSDELEWNDETIKSYWKWYGIPTGNVEKDVRLF